MTRLWRVLSLWHSTNLGHFWNLGQRFLKTIGGIQSLGCTGPQLDKGKSDKQYTATLEEKIYIYNYQAHQAGEMKFSFCVDVWRYTRLKPDFCYMISHWSYRNP